MEQNKCLFLLLEKLLKQHLDHYLTLNSTETRINEFLTF